MNPASVAESADGATAVVVTAALERGRPGGGDGGDGRGGLHVGDSATEGTDYQTVSDFTVTIGANAPSGTGTFTLTPTQDALGEGDEAISVEEDDDDPGPGGDRYGVDADRTTRRFRRG